MNEHNMKVLTNIIGAVESGGQVYGVRDYSAYVGPYTNSSKEHTITLGWAQNYGYEAQKLIKMIFNRDPNKFMMIDKDGVIQSVLNADWVKYKWNPSSHEKEILIKLITSEAGKECQDELFEMRMANYISDCKNDYTSNPKAIVMYCEIRHLGGVNAVDRIFKRCKFKIDYSLEGILNSLKLDQKLIEVVASVSEKDAQDESNQNLVGCKRFWSRHQKCAEFAEKYIIVEELVMTEQNIIICGHGSAKPSTKNMYDYNTQRYNSLATNGKHRGLIEVRRLKGFTDQNRKGFHDYYSQILNRNIYNQDLREYCYKKYSDGNYYSDCSSSGIKTYAQLGFKFPWTLNTAAIHTSDQFETVDTHIVNGHVQNPEVLKVGDALLYVGNDPSRPLQIGHVEFVYEIRGESKSEYPKWIVSGEDWYYRLSEGINAHGWLKIPETTNKNNVHWYYFDEKGKMATDWNLINGKWYYFEPSGALEGALYHESDEYVGALEIWYV